MAVVMDGIESDGTEYMVQERASVARRVRRVEVRSWVHKEDSDRERERDSEEDDEEVAAVVWVRQLFERGGTHKQTIRFASRVSLAHEHEHKHCRTNNTTNINKKAAGTR